MQAFNFLKSTDEIVSRTYKVQNVTVLSPKDSPKGERLVTQKWVWFTKPIDSFESELASHLPPPCDLTVSLTDILHDIDLFPAHLGLLSRPAQRMNPRDYRLATKAWKASKDDPVVKELLGADWMLSEQALAQKPQQHVPGILMEAGDVVTRATYVDRPPPDRETLSTCVPVEVSDLFVQIVFAIRAMLTTLFDVGGRLCATEDFLGHAPASCVFSAIDIMSRWSIEEFVPNMKYWKDFPMASMLENPKPKVPASWSAHQLHEGDPLFSGRLREFWFRLCTPPSDEVAALHFNAVFSISQSKRGCAAIPESFKQSAFESHAEKLAQKAPDLSTETSKDLARFLKVLFRNFRPKGLIKSLNRQEGSTSASAALNRAKGGQRDEVRQDLSKILGTSTNGLVRMAQTDQGVREERGLLPPSHSEWARIASLPLDLKYSALPHGVVSSIPPAWRQYPYCKVVALAEDLKCRIITKMSGVSTFLATPLQKALWNHLATFPCFALTTKTFSEEDLHDMLSREGTSLGPRTAAKLLSGDYSAATDGVNLNGTKQCLEEALTHFSEEDESLKKHCRTILYEQVLIYPEETQIQPVLQQTGQLMGSKISFPFLCILNLFTYVMSLPDELRERVLSGRFSLHKLAVLINGDDILFKADAAQYDRWLAAAKSVGFSLSLGKNFFHPRFCTVNSIPISVERTLAPAKLSRRAGIPVWSLDTSRMGSVAVKDPSQLSWAELDLDVPESYFKPSVEIKVYGFINLGLLFGTWKPLDAKGFTMATPLATWHDKATSGAMSPLRAHGLFLHYHSAEIARQTRFGEMNLNLFAHVYLGGLGFKIPEGLVPRYSEPQRRLASKLLRAAQKEYYGSVGDHPHKPFAYLTVDQTTQVSLGTVGSLSRVTTRMEPAIGPLPEDVDLFDPNTTIAATPLAVAMGDPNEKSYLTPSCRLPNSELRRISKTAKNNAILLPVAQMHTFPFRVVSFDPSVQASLDDPHSSVEEDPASTSSDESHIIGTHIVPEPPVSMELWEITFPSYLTSGKVPDGSARAGRSIDLLRARSELKAPNQPVDDRLQKKMAFRESRLLRAQQGLTEVPFSKDRQGVRWSRKG